MDTHHQAQAAYEYNYQIRSDLSDNEAICQRNIQQALRLFNHDFSDLEEVVTEDFFVHGPASGQETKGVEAVKQMEMVYAIAYPDAQYKVHDMFAAGDKVAVRWSVEATHLGERRGLQINGRTQTLAPTYRKATLDGTHIFRFNQEGKITDSWAMWDRLGEIEHIADISIVAKSPK